MTYKFFTNKHDLIGERGNVRHEIRLESRDERVRGESRDES